MHTHNTHADNIHTCTQDDADVLAMKELQREMILSVKRDYERAGKRDKERERKQLLKTPTSYQPSISPLAPPRRDPVSDDESDSSQSDDESDSSQSEEDTTDSAEFKFRRSKNREMFASDDESFRSFDLEYESGDDVSSDSDPEEDAFARIVAALPAGTARK